MNEFLAKLERNSLQKIILLNFWNMVYMKVEHPIFSTRIEKKEMRHGRPDITENVCNLFSFFNKVWY